MSLPALAELRRRFPDARIAILARPWVADLYQREPFADEIILYPKAAGFRQSWQLRSQVAGKIRKAGFDTALLLQNAFDAALLAWKARIPMRIGYARDGRSALLTHPIRVPRKGEIPPHESFYYLELLRRAGWLESYPSGPLIRLESAPLARAAGIERLTAYGLEGPVIGVSPGAAYGNAKRWPADRFVAAAVDLANRIGGAVALFGSADERSLCEGIQSRLEERGITAVNFAGRTSLSEFIDMAAACAVFLTNDSGAMHIASALNVPTVAVFGATNHITTGPTGPRARVIRRDVECSPCLLRECPLDHRCMRAVDPQPVADTAFELLQQKG